MVNQIDWRYCDVFWQSQALEAGNCGDKKFVTLKAYFHRKFIQISQGEIP